MIEENEYDHAQIKERVTAVVKKAEKGDIHSMLILACLYSKGKFYAKDYFAAEAWLRKAAELGSSEANKELAKLLSEGNGVAQDLEEAFDINYELMLDCDIDAMAEVGMAYKLGKGIEKNEKQGSFYILQAFDLELDNMREDLKASQNKPKKSSGTGNKKR